MTQHKWFTGKLLKNCLGNFHHFARQVILLKKQKEVTLLYVAESFCNFYDFCTPGSRGYYILVKEMPAERRDNDTFILLVIFLFEVIYLNYTELEQVHTYFIPTLCPFTSSKSTA